jgi:hypothetical protein
MIIIEYYIHNAMAISMAMEMAKLPAEWLAKNYAPQSLAD